MKYYVSAAVLSAFILGILIGRMSPGHTEHNKDGIEEPYSNMPTLQKSEDESTSFSVIPSRREKSAKEIIEPEAERELIEIKAAEEIDSEIVLLRKRIEELESALIEAAHSAEKDTDERIKWPENIDSRFSQEELIRNVNQGLLDIGLDAEVTLADCLEFPCLVVGESTEPFDRDRSQEIRESDFMQIYKDDSSYGFGSSYEAEDGLVYIFGLAVLPRTECREEQRKIRDRLNSRFGELQSADRP